MKKKNIIFSYASIALLFTFSGCSKDFLNQYSESNLNKTTFWKTESDIKQGVNGAYSGLRGLGTFSFWLFGEMRSDNTTFQYNAPQRGQVNREQVDQFLLNSANTLLQDYWRDCYASIFNCNDVIENIGNVPMDESAKNQAIGEMKFLRAFHYFNLVRQFGGVPLRLEATESPESAVSEGRASVDAVYQQIILDLTDAANQLPHAADYAAADKGRVSKGSANALLGEVYMTLKKFSDALTALRKVTGYSLMTSYTDIFKPENKNNVESIFEIQYYATAGTNLSSNFMYWFAPFNSGNVVTQDPTTNLSYNSGWNTPTTDLIAAYETDDLRKDASLAEGFEGESGFVSVPYIKKYNHGFVQPGQTNVNFPVIRYADVLLMIAECLNEQGFVANGEAFDLLNDIRERAGLKSKSAGNPVAALNITSQEEFRKAIYHERQIELAFENHRWYDLVRTGQAVSVLNAHGQREIAKEPSQYPSGAYQVTENKLLLPIPEREIMLDNLEQNPQ